MTQAHMFFNGSVFSPVDSFASAMVFKGDQVEWVGPDVSAESIRDDSMTTTDLHDQLVAPGFVAAGLPIEDSASAKDLAARLISLGYTAATLYVEPEVADEVYSVFRAAGLKTFIYLIADSADFSTESRAHGVLVDPLNEDATAQVQAATAAKLKVAFLGASPERIDRAFEMISGYEGLTKLRASFRIDGLVEATDEQIARALELSVSLGFVSQTRESNDSVRRSISAGVATVIGADAGASTAALGWDLIRSFVIRQTPEDQISARGAFNATTRGAYRALGEANPASGQLAPGAPADFAIWQAAELIVQSGSASQVMFSEDPRGRTSVLPALDTDDQPELMSLTVDGQTVYSKS